MYCQCHRYRRNVDDELRRLERAYLADRNDESYAAYRTARMRAKLSVPTFEFGYAAGVPLDVDVAWGARGIFDPTRIDIPPDRAGLYVTGDKDPNQMLSSSTVNSLLKEMQKTAAELRRHYEMTPTSEKEFLLAEQGDYVMIGYAYSYLHLAAFRKPPGWVGPTKWVKPPPPPPPPPRAPEHARRAYSSILIMASGVNGALYNVHKLRAVDVPAVLLEARDQLKAKTGAKTVSAFLKWLLAQNLESETRQAILDATKQRRRYY